MFYKLLLALVVVCMAGLPLSRALADETSDQRASTEVRAGCHFDAHHMVGASRWLLVSHRRAAFSIYLTGEHIDSDGPRLIAQWVLFLEGDGALAGSSTVSPDGLAPIAFEVEGIELQVFPKNPGGWQTVNEEADLVTVGFELFD